MAVYHRTQRLQIYGEKPEVTQLFGGRYRMVVRCKAARDTEAWYNANKDQIFASFGTLYSAQMSVDGIDPRTGEAYPDMCLVSNSASYTQTGEYVISFVYETLTAVWTKEQDDGVTSTDNGLRVLERSEVAKVDGFPIVQLSSPNSSKVVLSGMGNASNYFVLLVKANSANTIYWRATNEALATQTGSFTTANTDQWEYKVIYTPISIDQLEIGYNGTNYSTFDLSEFYLVSQSSNWQNNIVESFIEFEVTVDNPSPFTDTVVFTGSNGNTATGTNVQGGGTGSISSPYDEDDVGVATITDGGKTLYLAGFKDETQSETNVQIGRVVSRWAEAGTLSEVISNNTSGIPNTKTRTVTSIGIEPTSSGILINKSQQQQSGFITYQYTFLESSSGGDPTDGVLQSYETVIQVQKPGTIQGEVINQVAEIVQTPPTVGKVVATVSVSLTTTATTSLPVAYNLDGVSCSATFAQTRTTPVGVEQGNSLTVSVFNIRRTASVRPFPNHYRIGSGTSFSYTTPATIIRDNDNIIGEALDETHATSVTLTGSETAPATTGIYDEQVEPAFLDDAGVQYYRKTTYTI
jgi:hypothetical protein